MRQQDEATPPRVHRRDFLRQALTAGAGLAAVAVMPRGVAAAASDGIPPAAPQARGYHLTPHIRDYYQSATR
jgi:predicted nicotinamide N-methyase